MTVAKLPSRIIRRRFFIAAIAALLVAVPAFYLFYGGRGRLEAARAAARAKGYLSAPGADTVRPSSAEDKAQSALYGKAAAEFWKASDGATADFVPLFNMLWYRGSSSDPKRAQAMRDFAQTAGNPSSPLPDYMLQESRAFIDKRREILDLLHSAAQNEASSAVKADPDTEKRDLTVPMPTIEVDLAMLSQLADLAAWVDAEEGRPHDAAQRVRDAIALRRSFCRAPLRISQMAYVPPFGIAHPPVESLCETLERVTARTALSNEDLAALESDLDALAAEISAAPLLRARLSDIDHTYQAVVEGKLELTKLVNPAGYFPWTAKVEAWQLKISGVPFLFVGPLVRNDVAAAMEYATRLLDNTKSLSPDFFRNGWPPQSALRSGLADNVRFLCYEARQAEIDRARLRCASVALAAIRFRNDTGKLPDSLDALVPGYISKVPADPFSGEGLLHIAFPGRMAIYSVGANGEDEIASEQYDGATDTVRDIAFYIYDPALLQGESTGDEEGIE
jgi:hypothetical protein